MRGLLQVLREFDFLCIDVDGLFVVCLIILILTLMFFFCFFFLFFFIENLGRIGQIGAGIGDSLFSFITRCGVVYYNEELQALSELTGLPLGKV